MEQVISSEKSLFVMATIGGEPMRFELLREELETFEVMSGDSAFATFKSFARGQWSVRDMHTVLRMAHPKGYLHSTEDVRELVNRWGPANFVPLATRILEGVLFGLDPQDATWTLESMSALALEGEI